MSAINCIKQMCEVWCNTQIYSPVIIRFPRHQGKLLVKSLNKVYFCPMQYIITEFSLSLLLALDAAFATLDKSLASVVAVSRESGTRRPC